jgi:hypothetical protein
MASKSIDIKNMPKLPNIGYYNINSNDEEKTYSNNSYKILSDSLTKDCTKENWNINGIFNEQEVNDVPIPPNTKPLDYPFYLAKKGVLMDKLSKKTDINDNAKTQIQYLVCQLQKERNRVYNLSDFGGISGPSSIKKTFKRLETYKYILIIIFIISMYLFVSGFFGSIDVAGNIFGLIERNSNSGFIYWIGLLLGLAAPVFILSSIYVREVCKNLDDLNKPEITNHAYGIKNKKIDEAKKNFDILTLVLFILLLYAFVAALFTIKKKNMNGFLYSLIVGSILFVIACFIYALYAYVPFFNTANKNEIGSSKGRELRLFIDQQETLSNISTNKDDDIKLRKIFFYTLIGIIVLTILFVSSKFLRELPLLNGILASSAILSIPSLWVLNFIIAMNYFHLYPIILIVFRFIRYALMCVIFILAENSTNLKSSFSEDLLNNIDNFKNYSPSWGLLGIDELKILLGLFGFNNDFSKSVIPNNYNNSNLSQNKYVSNGYLTFIINFFTTGNVSNIKGLIITALIALITIILSVIILFGIAKI